MRFVTESLFYGTCTPHLINVKECHPSMMATVERKTLIVDEELPVAPCGVQVDQHAIVYES